MCHIPWISLSLVLLMLEKLTFHPIGHMWPEPGMFSICPPSVFLFRAKANDLSDTPLNFESLFSHDASLNVEPGKCHIFILIFEFLDHFSPFLFSGLACGAKKQQINIKKKYLPVWRVEIDDKEFKIFHSLFEVTIIQSNTAFKFFSQIVDFVIRTR